jgi:hypothetical protein
LQPVFQGNGSASTGRASFVNSRCSSGSRYAQPLGERSGDGPIGKLEQVSQRIYY